jgi:hypothetical protein
VRSMSGNGAKYIPLKTDLISDSLRLAKYDQG